MVYYSYCYYYYYYYYKTCSQWKQFEMFKEDPFLLNLALNELFVTFSNPKNKF